MNSLSSSKFIALGLILSFLILSLSCLHFQEMGVFGAMMDKGCSKIISIATYINLNKTQAGFLILFLILALILTSSSKKKVEIKSLSRLSLFSSRNTLSLSKTYDSFLILFKRGILHPKIYSFSLNN